MYLHSTLAGRHCTGNNLLYRLTVYAYECFPDLLRGASREKQNTLMKTGIWITKN